MKTGNIVAAAALAFTLLLPAAAESAALRLTWSDNSDNELGFGIERCQGAGCANFVEIARTAPNVVEALDATVLADRTYCYRVYAFNNDAAGNEQRSSYTNIGCATTRAPEPEPVPIPGAPSGLEALEVQATSLRLRWQASDNDTVVAQQIEINDHPQGRAERYRLLTAVLPGLREWKIAGLSPNSTYHFRMRRCVAADSLCSAYSNAAGAKTPR
jgi:hypothetical protein